LKIVSLLETTANYMQSKYNIFRHLLKLCRTTYVLQHTYWQSVEKEMFTVSRSC